MRAIVLGGDGYLGWPTTMRLAAKGYQVLAVDNYLRRDLAKKTDSPSLMPTPLLPERAERLKRLNGLRVEVLIGDCTDPDVVHEAFRRLRPDVVIHFAEQPSAPYSMIGQSEAHLTLRNNLETTFNVIWSVIQHAPECHIVKLGTMGEYGTPNIDIEEGWIDIEHKGRTDKFLFPRAAGSLYHTTKILDTDLLWFYTRTYDLRVTDLMQGPVYGLSSPECDLDDGLLPHFHYDDIFGTVVNRFLAQAVAGVPLTVYGKGGQKRGYLNLLDTLQCLELTIAVPPAAGQLRILNQFTETLSVTEIAARVREAASLCGLQVESEHVENPRLEKEEHYYNPAHSGLLELGLEPTFMTTEVLVEMLNRLQPYANRIERRMMYPRVQWRSRRDH